MSDEKNNVDKIANAIDNLRGPLALIILLLFLMLVVNIIEKSDCNCNKMQNVPKIKYNHDVSITNRTDF